MFRSHSARARHALLIAPVITALSLLALSAGEPAAGDSRSNPAGGGASEATEAPRYRTWGELYGITSKTAPQT